MTFVTEPVCNICILSTRPLHVRLHPILLCSRLHLKKMSFTY